jgi:hypothetical protein
MQRDLVIMYEKNIEIESAVHTRRFVRRVRLQHGLLHVQYAHAPLRVITRP